VPGLVTGVATIPATIAVLEAGGGITGLFAVEAAAVLGNLLWTSALARRLAVHLPAPAPVPPELRARFLSFAWSTTLIILIHFVVWRRSELFVMQHFSTDAEIAFYSIAFAAVSGLSKLPEAIEVVAIPAVANLVGTGEDERIRRGFWRAMRLLVLATLPIVAGAAVVGPSLLELLYGAAFADTGTVLLVMLAPLLVQPLLRVSEGVLYGLERARFIVGAGVVATVVDIALAFALIPSLDAVGAAIANGAAILVAGVPCLVLAARLHVPVDIRAGPLLRAVALALIVAGASGGVLLALGTGVFATLLGVIAGSLAFVLFAVLLRPLAADDAAWLAGALGGTAGRFVTRIGR
jgi:O-antigen/teichoic acid export membrane protein